MISLNVIGDEMMSAGYEVLTIKADVGIDKDCQFLISETINSLKKLMFLLIMLEFLCVQLLRKWIYRL